MPRSWTLVVSFYHERMIPLILLEKTHSLTHYFYGYDSSAAMQCFLKDVLYFVTSVNASQNDQKLKIYKDQATLNETEQQVIFCRKPVLQKLTE